jgi:hypothetical protein
MKRSVIQKSCFPEKPRITLRFIRATGLKYRLATLPRLYIF